MKLQRLFEGYLAACVRRTLKSAHPVVVAVAGSVGKSSTKMAIGVALGAGEPGCRVIVSPKNYNNELGVPLTVFQCDAPGKNPLAWMALLLKAGMMALGLGSLQADIVVLEMGTDHPGDLDYLLRMAHPHIGVLTAIGPEHTEFFGDVQGVAQEEGAIFRALRAGDVAVANADDARVSSIVPAAGVRVLSFGQVERATARLLETHILLDEAHPERSGLEMKIALFGTTHLLHLDMVAGRPQALACAAALAVAAALDTDEDVAVERLMHSFSGMPGRMRLLPAIKHCWLLDDSYNSSPLAALSALRDLAAFPLAEGAKRIAALGDMLELGALSEDAHIEIGRAVAELGIDTLVACGTLAHVVSRAAIEAGMAESAVFTFPKSDEAGRFIQERMREGDVVLIKGSQGSRMEKVTKELMADPLRASELLVRQSKEWLEK